MTARKSAPAIFKARFNGNPNIMTPDLMRYGWKDGLAYELAHGDSIPMRGQPPGHIYGVTVLNPDGTDAERDGERLSTCLHSLPEALAYIQTGFTLPA